MRFTSAVLALAAMSTTPDISVIDSQTHTGYSWILVNDCAVEVKTYDIKFHEGKVINQVNEQCNLDLSHVTSEKQ